jgi:hypothetical protein
MKMEEERQYLGRKRLTISAYREKRHRIFHLLRQGLTYVEVAREVNLSPRRIGQIAARGGVRPALSWNSEAIIVLVRRGRDTPGGGAEKLGFPKIGRPLRAFRETNGS